MRRCLFAAGLLTLSLGCEDTALIAQVDWLNPQSVDFGPRVVGSRYTEKFTLTNRANTEAVVGSVRFDPDVAAFTARTENNDTLTGQPLREGRPLDVRIHFEPAEVKAYDTAMLISVGGTEVPLPIKASGVEGNTDILVTPSTLDFGPVLIGSRVSRTIEVENAGDRSMSLVEVFSGGLPMPDRMDNALFYLTKPGEQTAVRDVFFAAGDRQTFEVHFKPSAETQSAAELDLRFTTRNAIVVTSGTGVVPGALECAPVFHDFGQKIRGQFDRASVRCTAVDGAVRLSNVGFEVGASRFFGTESAPPVGRLLAAGESVLFHVNFVAQGLPKVHEAEFTLTPEGGGVATTLFFRAEVVAPPIADTQVSVSLNWDTPGTDLDLHFIRRNEAPFNRLHDCFFEQKNPDWGIPEDPLDNPYLDRDDINGYGPEEMNLALVSEVEYNVYVHYYNSPVGGRPTIANVPINLFGVEVARPVHQFTNCGESWHVGRITVDGASRLGSFTPSGAVTDLVARSKCP